MSGIVVVAAWEQIGEYWIRTLEALSFGCCSMLERKGKLATSKSETEIRFAQLSL